MVNRCVRVMMMECLPGSSEELKIISGHRNAGKPVFYELLTKLTVQH